MGLCKREKHSSPERVHLMIMEYGLSSVRKIIESHGGDLDLVPGEESISCWNYSGFINIAHTKGHHYLHLHKQWCPLYFPSSSSIIFLIALIPVKVNFIPRLYIANTSFRFSTSTLSNFLCIVTGCS